MDKTTRLALGRLAASQRGLFSVAQASDIGVNNVQLLRAESSGALRRVRRGVYAMAGIALSPWEQIVAAALAAGPDAVVSHASAAAVHRFEYGPLGIVELTLPRQGRFRPPGVTVHRSTDLAAEDIVEKNGVLVTSAPADARRPRGAARACSHREASRRGAHRAALDCGAAAGLPEPCST